MRPSRRLLRRPWLRYALALTLFPTIATAASGPQSVADSSVSSLPRSELSSLRFAVTPDLSKAVATFENTPRTRDVSEEWKQCKFTPIHLGTLGPAVVVEWNPVKAPNASMINIYLPRNGQYRLLLANGGFGPTLLPGPNPVPDLVFGATGGVCHATYSRYRWLNEHYEVNACNQETEGKDGNCAIISCANRKLPTFPNPFPN